MPKAPILLLVLLLLLIGLLLLLSSQAREVPTRMIETEVSANAT